MNKQNILLFLISFLSIYASDNTSLSLFEELPLEKQQEIIVHLPVHDIWNIRAVSPYFKDLVNTCTGINFLQKFVQEDYPYIKVEDETFRSFLKKAHKIKNFFWKAENPLVHLENNLSVEHETNTYTEYTIVIPEYIEQLRKHSQYEQEIEKIESRKIIRAYRDSFCKNSEYDSNTIFYGSLNILQTFDKQPNPFYKYVKKNKSNNNFYYQNVFYYFYARNQKTDEELISIISEYKPSYTKEFLEMAIKKSSLPVISFLTQDMSYISNDIVEYAAKYSAEALQFFIEEKRVKPARICNEFCQTPIIIATIHDNTKAVEYLIALNNQLLYAKDHYGYFVLDYALVNQNTEILNLIGQSFKYSNINYDLQKVIDTDKVYYIENRKLDFLHSYFENIFSYVSDELVEKNKKSIQQYFLNLFIKRGSLISRNEPQWQQVLQYIDLFYKYHFNLINACPDLKKNSKKIVDYIELTMHSAELLKKLLRLDCFNSETNRSICFALACKSKNYDILNELLASSQSININHSIEYYNDGYQKNSLQIAVSEDDIELFTILINNGANIYGSFNELENYKNIFDYICGTGINYQMLDLLLKKGFDKGCSRALFIAIERNNIRLLKYLYKKGFNIYQLDKEGRNLFCKYMYTKYAFDIQEEMIQFFFEKEFSVEDGFLHIFVKDEHFGRFKNIILLLIEYGADINGLSNDGNTLLTSVVTTANIDSIQFLLEHGALLLVKNVEGKNALDIFEAKYHDILSDIFVQNNTLSPEEVIKAMQKNSSERKEEHEERKKIQEIHQLLRTKAEEEKNSPEIMNIVDEKNKISILTKIVILSNKYENKGGVIGDAISILKNRYTWGVIGVIASLTAFYFAKDLFFNEEGVVEENAATET